MPTPDTIRSFFAEGFKTHGATAVGLLFAVVTLIVGACEYTARSPITGEEATRPQLAADRETVVADFIAEQDASARQYELAVARISTDAQQQIDQAAADFDASAAARTNTAESMARQFDLATEEIERKEAKVSMILGALNAAAQLDPRLSGGLAIASVLLSGGAVYDTRRQRTKVKQAEERASHVQ
ncbi:MAG: hypothetical protein KAS72_07770 [Phycisphaerales bacterium]|nr:hypothetical protein [Phycisphaerales bacterium]